MNRIVRCEICGAAIPPKRLEILPNTTTCVKCSETQPYSETDILGFNITEDHELNNVEDFEEEEF